MSTKINLQFCFAVFILLASLSTLMFAMEIENLKGVDNAVIDEELLTHHVQQFSVMYDKSHKDFHRKDVKRNADLGQLPPGHT